MGIEKRIKQLLTENPFETREEYQALLLTELLDNWGGQTGKGQLQTIADALEATTIAIEAAALTELEVRWLWARQCNNLDYRNDCSSGEVKTPPIEWWHHTRQAIVDKYYPGE